MVRKRLDVLMVILMIIVMSYQAVGNLFHEVAGVVLLVLFLVHNILNRKWYQNMARGKYSVFRKTMLAVDILTLISMLAAMGTGIWAFLALDMPNRLLLRDMGEYWRYSGILLFAANAAVMALL